MNKAKLSRGEKEGTPLNIQPTPIREVGAQVIYEYPGDTREATDEEQAGPGWDKCPTDLQTPDQ